MKKIILTSLLLVTGCIGLYDEPLYYKDNHQIFRAVCNGNIRDIGDCYALASKRCAGDFEVVKEMKDKILDMKNTFKSSDYSRSGTRQSTYRKGDSRSVTFTDGGLNTQANTFETDVVTRSVLFYCK